MTLLHRVRLTVSLLGLTCLSSVAITLAASIVSAAPIPSASTVEDLSDRLNLSFRQPDTGEVSAPRDRPRGGGARPICSEADVRSLRCSALDLAALVPFPERTQTEPDGQTVTLHQAWGQTLEPTPTLWFYIPYRAEAIASIEFELLDESDRVVAHDSEVSVNATPGVIRYTPTLSSPLEVGRTYRWTLLLRFDPTRPATDELVSGRIKRVAADAQLVQQLDSAASALERAHALAEAGIWYDMLTTLATVYQTHSATWAELLQSVGLEQIADEPLVNCCTEPHRNIPLRN